MTDARSVASILIEGAKANLEAPCRVGSIDLIRAPGELIATGDLHDNPIHLGKLLEAANLDGEGPDPARPPRHLVLHEIGRAHV